METTQKIGRPSLGCTFVLRLAIRPEVETRLRELADFGGIPMTQVARTLVEDGLVNAGVLDAAEISGWEHRR